MDYKDQHKPKYKLIISKATAQIDSQLALSLKRWRHGVNDRSTQGYKFIAPLECFVGGFKTSIKIVRVFFLILATIRFRIGHWGTQSIKE